MKLRVNSRPLIAAVAVALAIPVSLAVVGLTASPAAAAVDLLLPYPVGIGNDKTSTGSIATSKVLGIQAPRDQNRSAVIQGEWSGADDQSWDVRIVNQSMVFINRASGKALTVEDNSSANGTRAIQWTHNEANRFQQWRTDVDIDGDGYPNLRNVGNGKCLGIEGGGSTEAGKKAHLWDCNAHWDQEWWFYPTPKVTTGQPRPGVDTEEPDAEIEPIEETVEEEAELPEWVDGESVALDVGESEFQEQVTGGATGGDATLPHDDEPMDPGAVGKTFEAATQGADVTAFARPVAKTLSLKHYSQNTGYYCGPASGYMMLRFLNAGRSKYNNAKLSQKALASSAHMNTDNDRATLWTGKRFAKGINRWRGNNFYIQVPAPSKAIVEGALRATLGNRGLPIAADTVEFANGKHYNGHPRHKLIGHWIVGYGYQANGATVLLADPATSVFRGAKPKFKMSSKDLTFFLKSNGIVY